VRQTTGPRERHTGVVRDRPPRPARTSRRVAAWPGRCPGRPPAADPSDGDHPGGGSRASADPRPPPAGSSFRAHHLRLTVGPTRTRLPADRSRRCSTKRDPAVIDPSVTGHQGPSSIHRAPSCQWRSPRRPISAYRWCSQQDVPETLHLMCWCVDVCGQDAPAPDPGARLSTPPMTWRHR